MSFALGLKALRRLCIEQDQLAWQRAKLSSELFKPLEKPVFEFVQSHLKMFHVLPQMDTLGGMFPEIASIETPEPSTYYVRMLENRFFYEKINNANLEAQNVLQKDQDNHAEALAVMSKTISEITLQKYRLRIMNVGKELPAVILGAYHNVNMAESFSIFGWPYMDEQFGVSMPGEVISFVGRPAAGKTWLTLWTALKNWTRNTDKKENVLFVSMEMMTLPIAQRIAALYTNSPITQLKTSAFALPTYQKFVSSLSGMNLEGSNFYVIDGNLAASAEDIFVLADILQCRIIVIDGGYLLRHKNTRLDRFTRAAENVELIKRYSTDMDKIAFCSWQLSRKATEKQKKTTAEEAGLEDIGYSDAIGQISSIVLGLFQEDSVETMKQRKVRVMKGRNGEVGQFSIAWDFNKMSFDQVDPPVGKTLDQIPDLQWI